jgi:hypothetical protein
MPSEMGSLIANFLGLKEGNPFIAMLNARSERASLLVEKRLKVLRILPVTTSLPLTS